MTIVVNADAGLVWIDGKAIATSKSIAKLISLLYGRKDNLVKYSEIEGLLGITYHTRTAYIHQARQVLDKSEVRLRTVKGEGVVLEQIPEAVAA